MSDPRFTTWLMTDAVHSAAEDARHALAKKRDADEAWKAARKASYGWARIGEVTKPCAMWRAPWIFDPEDPEKLSKRERALGEIKAGTFSRQGWFLSRHYWTDWSAKRPPLCVLCPNGEEWCVDARSTNGEGWKVTGEPPAITCSPSIVVPGYHGFLKNGVFTEDLDGKRGGGVGIVR